VIDDHLIELAYVRLRRRAMVLKDRPNCSLLLESTHRWDTEKLEGSGETFFTFKGPNGEMKVALTPTENEVAVTWGGRYRHDVPYIDVWTHLDYLAKV
jgi:hypothetical protein